MLHQIYNYVVTTYIYYVPYPTYTYIYINYEYILIDVCAIILNSENQHLSSFSFGTICKLMSKVFKLNNY